MLKLKRELNREKICCFAFPDYYYFFGCRPLHAKCKDHGRPRNDTSVRRSNLPYCHIGLNILSGEFQRVLIKGTLSPSLSDITLWE